jgi:hypothetical protein
MGLQGSPVTCADCGADLTPRHGRIVVTMETGHSHRGAPLVPRAEVKLCVGCAAKGVSGEKLGLFDGPSDKIASRQ